MNNNDQDGPVIVKVPVIIDKDRFLRVVVRRTSRSPRKTPPLHVTPKTLCKRPAVTVLRREQGSASLA
jgi:hypothetical protein